MSYKGAKYTDEIGHIRECIECSLCNNRRNVVIYRGNPRADIMAVGEAPGYNEDRLCKAFVGKTGGYFVNVLETLGLPLKKLYLTNVVLCKPPNNDDPTEAQMDSCSEWLNLQIRLVDPKFIIAVGKIALSRLDPDFSMKHGRITREEGIERKPPSLRGRIVIPVRHPSGVLRRQDIESSILENYEAKLKEIVDSMRARCEV